MRQGAATKGRSFLLYKQTYGKKEYRHLLRKELSQSAAFLFLSLKCLPDLLRDEVARFSSPRSVLARRCIPTRTP